MNLKMNCLRELTDPEYLIKTIVLLISKVADEGVLACHQQMIGEDAYKCSINPLLLILKRSFKWKFENSIYLKCEKMYI